MREGIVNAIITHQKPAQVGRMLEFWAKNYPKDELLIVYGGNESAFKALPDCDSVLIGGDGHRTIDHQRERQSYSGALIAINKWLKGRQWHYVNLLEYDVIPLIENWNDRLRSLAETDAAALLCYKLHRIDKTSDPHWLNHQFEERFAEFWRAVSVREDPTAILTMIGCNQFWRRDAFEQVAQQQEPFPIYMELYLPTLAHHLGFRVREVPDQTKFMRSDICFRQSDGDAKRREGAWALHPVKSAWDEGS